MTGAVDFEHWRDGATVEVYLDGERVPQCVRASRGQGWAEVFVMLDNQVARDGLDRPLTKVIKGRVTYRREDPASWR